MEPSGVLLIVTGTDKYPGGNPKTGLWLSELTHMRHLAMQCGYAVTVASPEGGLTPLDPVSLKRIYLDPLSRDCWKDPVFREVLLHTKSLKEVTGRLFDCVYLAGGHGAMFDFPDNAALQAIVREHYENGKTVAAICHGVSGLLNVRLSDGTYLIADKKLTGFSWFEEILAGRSRLVPFDLEARLKERRARYVKSWIPMIPKVVVDGNLITGQDPFSSNLTARAVVKHLAEKLKRNQR